MSSSPGSASDFLFELQTLPRYHLLVYFTTFFSKSRSPNCRECLCTLSKRLWQWKGFHGAQSGSLLFSPEARLRGGTRECDHGRQGLYDSIKSRRQPCSYASWGLHLATQHDAWPITGAHEHEAIREEA